MRITLFITGALCLFAFVDCSPTQTCAPGKTESCACLGGSQAGVQTCNADGSGWGACVCPNEQKDGGGGVDKDVTCTRIFGDICCSKHPSEDVTEKTPGCSGQGACDCLVTPSGLVFVCAGSKDSTSWKFLSGLQGLCSTQTIKSNPTLHCARDELVCDVCPGSGTAWRFVDGGCAKGVLKQEE